MAWIIKIRPLGYVDLDNIIEWYNKQRNGLGKEFLIEFNEHVKKLEENPLAYIILFEPVRRITLKRFPYKVLFTVGEQEVIILGIVHHKRSNRYLKRYR